MKTLFIMGLCVVGFNVRPCFALEPSDICARFCGSYVCWEEPYNHSRDSQDVEFKNYPFLNIRQTKAGKLIGELWGIEKIVTGNQQGYYRVVVSNLNIKSDGQISFEIGERILYSKPMGWDNKKGIRIGIDNSKMVYIGNFSDQYQDDLNLKCNGVGCFNGARVFSRDEP